MTFEQFQATRREATIAEMEELAGFQADDCTGGLIYGLKGLYIVRIDHKDGKYFLILERDEFISDDLEGLERKLYQWGVDAGAIERDMTAPCSICGRTPEEHDDEECRREYED